MQGAPSNAPYALSQTELPMLRLINEQIHAEVKREFIQAPTGSDSPTI